MSAAIPFRAASLRPPLMPIDLSLGDKFLYVSCWGHGRVARRDDAHPSMLAVMVVVAWVVYKKLGLMVLLDCCPQRPDAFVVGVTETVTVCCCFPHGFDGEMASDKQACESSV